MEEKRSSVHWLTIDASYVGQRIDNFLRAQYRTVPKSLLYRILRRGEVRVNSKRVKPTYRLQEHDKLRIPPIRLAAPSTSCVFLSASHADQLRSQIVYEDEAVMVMNKPSGVAVHGGSGVTSALINQIRQLGQDYERAVLVHRLDRATSGCLLLVKDRCYLAALHAAWHSDRVTKRYVALVQGVWSQGRATLEDALYKVRHADGSWAVTVADGQAQTHAKKAKVARTEVHLRQQGSELSLLELSLNSGRTHQIRVQLANAGYPIVGDDKYGDFSLNRKLKQLGYQRLMLHAEYLEFPHPETIHKVCVHCPVSWDYPDELLP